MRTDQRLTEAYENARVEPINEHTRYVFFSDCHRGNGSLADEFTRNENAFLHALEYYYKHQFTYVEAGDGDELWEHHDFSYIKRAHADVFDTLERFYLSDRLIMLYGNHNVYIKDPEYVEENYHSYYDHYHEKEHPFLDGLTTHEGLLLRSERTGQEILTVHGHQGDFLNDQFWFFTMLSLKYFWRFLHAFGIQNPASPVKNPHKRHKIERNYVKWIAKHRRMLICGHTHQFKYPKEEDLPYFNTGSCIYPTRITAMELVGEQIQAVQWRTVANQQGVLEVQREVLRGPDPISKFDIRE